MEEEGCNVWRRESQGLEKLKRGCEVVHGEPCEGGAPRTREGGETDGCHGRPSFLPAHLLKRRRWLASKELEPR